MTRRTFLGGCVILLAAAAGCYTGGSALEGPFGASAGKGTTTTVSGTEGTGPKVTGLPCDVAAILATSCASCHGDKLKGGAPNRMMTHADLTSLSRTDGARSVAEVTMARLEDAADPMPPDGQLPAKDIKIIADWIAAGMPEGSCDAAVDGAATVSEYDTPVVCSSKKHWTSGDEESSLMHPGVACIDCHDREDDAPSFIAAGTVYRTAHEPDDCNGIAGSGTKVVITDADGKVFTQSVNGAGNFYFETKKNKMALPYRAKIVTGTKTRIMKDAVTTGDCNACHTEKGDESAPGRVMAP